MLIIKVTVATDELNPYSMNAETESEFGQIFNSGITYSEAFKLYVDRLIFPEDKTMMLRHGSVDYIRRRLARQKTFVTQYRSKDGRYNEMKFVKVNDELDAPTAVALGFADRDEVLRAEMEGRRYSEIANALSGSYTSIYYVDTTDDSYIEFGSEGFRTWGISESGQHFFDESAENLKIIGYPEDMDIPTSFIRKEHLLKALESGEVNSPEYRLLMDGVPTYFRMRAIRSTQDKDHIIIGVSNVDQDVRERAQEQEKLRRNLEIIDILASEYTSVYYIDLATDELDPYTMNEETETEFGSIFRSGIPYSEAFHLYVDSLVYADDKADMLRAGSLFNISEQLRDKKSFTTTYRSDNKGNPRYCEMRFVKVGDALGEPEAVALGFADRDAEIRRDIASHRNQEIIQTLSDEYTSVYHVDLETGEMTLSKMSAGILEAVGNRFYPGIRFSEALDIFLKLQVKNSDYDELVQFESVDYLRDLLRDQKIYSRTYRVGTETDFRYYEMKMVKVNESGEATAFVLGIADRDAEIRARLQAEVEQRRNTEIIEILASEYSSVYYIDLTTDELTPYSMNAETENQFGVLFKNMKYSEAYRLYVDSMIFSEDKSMMLKAGSLGNIMKELRTKKTFLTTYRSENNGDPHYCEMKFVKVGNEDGSPRAVALGFADKDDELRQRIEQETVRQRNTDIIEILASEYTSVYYIDMTTGELDPYTMNEEVETEFGTIFRSGIQYSDAFELYVDSLVYPEDKAMMLKAGSVYNILEELRDKKSFTTTYRSDNQGDPRYCEMRFVKVGDDDNPQAVALGFSDRHDEIRKEMEEIAEREKNFEIIDILASEYSSVYYIDLESDGVTPYTMNDSTREFFEDAFLRGITYSEAFGLYVANAVAPESRELMLRTGSIANLRETLKNQKTFITTYLNNDNLYSEMKFVKVGDENVEPKAVALGFSVVDEAYRKELANRQREAFINGLADDYEAVFHVDGDRETIETVRMSDAYLERNPSLEEHMNYSDYVEAVAANIIPQDKQAFIDALSRENVEREFAHENAFFHNYRVLRRGVTTYYQLKIIYTGDWATDHNFLIGVHNMDEMIRAQVEQEEILEEAREEAESANVAKSTFLFNMSHDIRTPMNAIIGFNNMAKKHIDDTDRVLECLDKVEVSSKHLLSIINDVLDMARIESGKVNIEEERTLITKSAEELTEIVKQSVQDKKLTFITDFSDVRHNCVFADKLRVDRVIMNIATNAIKYTGTGGVVTYRIFEKESTRPGCGSYDFVIEDTGIGMTPEFVDHIYEAFVRESTSTISGIQGTGLGMAITKSLVDLMGGTIDIQSELGVGTTVTVHFDFRIAEENYVEHPEEDAIDVSVLEGKKILLVEDNELNREIAREILEEYGMIVDEAEDGVIAVKKVARRKTVSYDAILMDIQMPTMDGYHATEEIRRLPVSEKIHIPIIAMTANAFEEDKQRAVDAGMDAHLAKPIDMEQLVRTLVKFM